MKHSTETNLEGERPREPYILGNDHFCKTYMGERPREPKQEDPKMPEHNTLPVRSRPAHPTPIQRHNEPIILFVTLCIRPRGNFLCVSAFHDAFIAGCKEASHWCVGKYMIMPDHIHLFCSPESYFRESSIKAWVSYLKRMVTKYYPQHVWKWQSNCWDTQLRNIESYHEKWEYVRNNPVRAGLVNQSDEWLWQGELQILRW